MSSIPWGDLTVTGFGTLLGVLGAFWLDRFRDRNQSKQRYGQWLAACFYDLSHAQATCEQIAKQLSPGKTNVLEVSAPVLDAFLRDPILYEHGTHGLVIALTTVSRFIDVNCNVLNQYRLASAFGNTMTAQAISDLQERVLQLGRLSRHVERVIESELKNLGLGLVRTPEDKRILDELNKVLRNEAGS